MPWFLRHHPSRKLLKKVRLTPLFLHFFLGIAKRLWYTLNMMKCPHCQGDIPMALFTRYIGKLGGSKTSAAKKLSSRENGKKGGRPRKQKGKH